VSKQPSSPSPKPKATFAAASFANLRAATGDAGGEPLQLAIDEIDEDPEQPRRDMDPEDLQSLAESIRYRGVLQPIGVKPGSIGRYTLVFGARRLRATRMAGKTTIPALIVHQSQRDLATQVIENQQRANLSNEDLAGAVKRLSADRHTNKEIEAICNLKEWQVAAYRAVERFPPFLTERLNSGDMRALYDLFRQWGHTAAEVEAVMPEPETYITVTEARRIIGRITGKPTGSIVIAREEQAAATRAALIDESPTNEEPLPPPIATSANGESGALIVQGIAPRPGQPEGRSGASPEPARAARPDRQTPPQAAEAGTQVDQSVEAPNPPGVPTFVVAMGDGEYGRLIVDRKAATQGWALVQYANAIEEVEAKNLRIVAIE